MTRFIRVEPFLVRLVLCAGGLAAPGAAFAFPVDGDISPPAGTEYTSPLPATASASSTYWGTGPVEAVLDGSESTLWNSGNWGPSSITMNFDPPRTFNGVHVIAEAAGPPGGPQEPGFATHYVLTGYDDNGEEIPLNDETWTITNWRGTNPAITGHDFEFGVARTLTSLRIEIDNAPEDPLATHVHPHPVNNLVDSWIGIYEVQLITPIATADGDGDGDPDGADNCPTIPNESQSDGDGDGIGDACEADADNDGKIDDVDNCDLVPNVDQANSDGDGQGDACDADDDDDSIADGPDNCDLTWNTDQADADGDGQGDACDGDDDSDGVEDPDDDCDSTPQDVPIDDHGCSGLQRIVAACGTGAGSNHGAYVSCVVHEANAAVAEGLLTNTESAAIKKSAATKKK